jgi:lipoprotein Spr
VLNALKRPFRLLLFVGFLLDISSCSSKQKLSSSTSSGESNPSLQKKYAAILGVEEAELSNVKLYAFIDKWMGTPYRYGGKNQSGVDCSGFAEILYKQVYGKEMTGSSGDLYLKCRNLCKEKLKEGDLVFFRIESDKISHVGVYLTNHKFVHATVHKGIMINDLNESYYLKYYYKGGRPEADVFTSPR